MVFPETKEIFLKTPIVAFRVKVRHHPLLPTENPNISSLWITNLATFCRFPYTLRQKILKSYSLTSLTDEIHRPGPQPFGARHDLQLRELQ